uniref:SCP domain-containing protein n=1 Tax=Acrobeloides nanus TaxID=290746 RepID=A0A914CBT7_9BILA
MLLIGVIFATFFAFLCSASSNNPFLVKPSISHSGPTNALWGHEELIDEEPKGRHERSKRAVARRGWGWQQPQQQYTWPNLLVSSEPPNDYLKMWLTSEHNRYRQMVPATNMRMLYWSDELAASAQRHADRCDFRHSRDRRNVGENIWAAPYSNYSDAITLWFQEVNNPWCGCNHAYKHCCGHYIQVVWAETNLVGCGFARCSGVWGLSGGYHRNVFVCHYNPQGNTLQVPAFRWATQQQPRCSECAPDAPACYEGLCYMPEGYNNGTTTTSTSLPPEETTRPMDYNRIDETDPNENNRVQRQRSYDNVREPWRRRSEQELGMRRRL